MPRLVPICQSLAGLLGAGRTMPDMIITPDKYYRVFTQVFEFINGHSTPIFAVFCVAGGTDKEIGYFTDIKPADIRDCMENNYFTTANTAHAIMKHWTAQDIGPAVEESCAETFPTAALAEHHLILTASTAAVISIPGYAAYSPAKAAVRALADTLRQEAFLHNSKRKKIHIHCTLPGTIYTESFYREQGKKPTLCKRIEGTLDNRGGLHVSDVTNRIFQALTKGRFLITTDWQTRLLLGVMRGASPAGSWMVLDLVLTILAGTLAPFATWYLDRMIQDSARQMP